jgi:hypothetical protein
VSIKHTIFCNVPWCLIDWYQHLKTNVQPPSSGWTVKLGQHICSQHWYMSTKLHIIISQTLPSSLIYDHGIILRMKILVFFYCLHFSLVSLAWNKYQFFGSDQPVLSVPCTSGQAWYLSKSCDSFVHESTRDTGLPHSPDPRLYVKVKGAPLKGQGTGPPAGSARNIEYKLASPVICPHIWSRLALKSQNAVISDSPSNQQPNSW